MNNVIDFAAAKEDRVPHMSGHARCLACKHEWVAVSPTGTLWLECPECTLLRGRYMYPVVRDAIPHLECNCGNDLFQVTPDGTYCPNCGVWQVLE